MAAFDEIAGALEHLAILGRRVVRRPLGQVPQALIEALAGRSASVPVDLPGAVPGS